MKRKKVLIILPILIIIYFFIKSPLFLTFRSYMFMKPYSYQQKLESILVKNDFDLYIPGGKITKERDWYPFILFHNADKGFSNYTNKELSLTILYNFGHFKFLDGYSTYYDPNSPYFGSFYGGYVVQNKKNPKLAYGFNDDGSLNIDEVILIPKYDQTKLVLPSLGCPSSIREFSSDIDNTTNDVKYLGIDGWTKINSTVKTNAPIHKYKKNYRGYIQYGKPIEKYYNGRDFPITTFKGRIYIKYIDQLKATVVMYILAPNENIIDKCDKEILSKSRIKIN